MSDKRTKNMTVACRSCLVVNKIHIGTSFYDADAMYQCGNCGHSSHVHVRQTPAPYEKAGFYQRGKIV